MATRDTVRLGVFSPSVVLGVAAATGALDRAGLAVAEVPAVSSARQLDDLRAGRLDAAFTSPDNVLAHRLAAADPFGEDVDVRILAAVDRGLGLSLFAAPGAGAGGGPDSDVAAALRGGVLAVDVPTSGFAFVAYELLAREGLRAGRDYQVVAWGTTPRRAAGLAAGEFAMTVLGAGGDLRAEAAGCVRVSRACSLGPYLGTVLVATRDALRERARELRALTAVVLGTGAAIVEGGLREAAAAVAAGRLALTGDAVAAHLDTLADPREGLVVGGRVDPAALETLRALRAAHAGPAPALDRLVAPGSPLVDPRFLAPTA